MAWQWELEQPQLLLTIIEPERQLQLAFTFQLRLELKPRYQLEWLGLIELEQQRQQLQVEQPALLVVITQARLRQLKPEQGQLIIDHLLAFGLVLKLRPRLEPQPFALKSNRLMRPQWQYHLFKRLWTRHRQDRQAFEGPVHSLH